MKRNVNSGGKSWLDFIENCLCQLLDLLQVGIESGMAWAESKKTAERKGLIIRALYFPVSRVVISAFLTVWAARLKFA